MKKFVIKDQFGAIAAFLTWLIVFAIVLYWLPKTNEQIQQQKPLIVFLFVLYICCFAAIVLQAVKPENKIQFSSVLITQILAAFSLMLLVPMSFISIFSIIWVAVLPHVFSIRKSLLLASIVIVCWFLLYHWRWQEDHVLFTALLYSTFHLFAILMNYETVKAEKATLEALRLNQELKTTQHLLSEASRQNERTRIARDLHDLLGHHLTALIINLQVAQHLTKGEAKDKVTQCHTLAKLLLSDVREAVSSIRNNNSINLDDVINVISDLFPNLSIEKNLIAEFSLDQIEIAQTLANCIQELITNSVKHAHANKVWISLTFENNTYSLKFHDNTENDTTWLEGNGIKGIRERVEALLGDVNMHLHGKTMTTLITIPSKQ